MNDRTATTQAASLHEHAADCAAKLARTAIRHGATEAEGIRIGMDLLTGWLLEDRVTLVSVLNARAAIAGQAAAIARGAK